MYIVPLCLGKLACDTVYLGFLDGVQAVCRNHLHDVAGFDLNMVTLLFYLDDVPSVLGAEGLADAADRRVINGFLQRIDIPKRRDPS